jgi:hypothetical protein
MLSKVSAGLAAEVPPLRSIGIYFPRVAPREAVASPAAAKAPQTHRSLMGCRKSKASVIPSAARDLLFVLTPRKSRILRPNFALRMTIRSFFPQTP